VRGALPALVAAVVAGVRAELSDGLRRLGFREGKVRGESGPANGWIGLGCSYSVATVATDSRKTLESSLTWEGLPEKGTTVTTKSLQTDDLAFDLRLGSHIGPRVIQETYSRLNPLNH
jgi:hypothetical protein